MVLAGSLAHGSARTAARDGGGLRHLLGEVMAVPGLEGSRGGDWETGGEKTTSHAGVAGTWGMGTGIPAGSAFTTGRW